MTGDVLERVAEAVRETSASTIEPRFRALAREDVREKSPGEVVTVADQEGERLLTRRLQDILPRVPVVGEEACAVDGSLVTALEGERAWLLDALDGTSNFVAGSGDWAVMVALVDHGVPVASWIWRPSDQRLYVAERGAGATCNGSPLVRSPAAHVPLRRLRGTVLTRYLDPPAAAAVERNRERFGPIAPGHRCAGIDYPLLAEGEIDFLLFWRALPWDHAPGTLLVQEAGATVRRLDRTAYLPAQTTLGLLSAADAATWDRARGLLT